MIKPKFYRMREKLKKQQQTQDTLSSEYMQLRSQIMHHQLEIDSLVDLVRSSIVDSSSYNHLSDFEESDTLFADEKSFQLHLDSAYSLPAVSTTAALGATAAPIKPTASGGKRKGSNADLGNTPPPTRDEPAVKKRKVVRGPAAREDRTVPKSVDPIPLNEDGQPAYPVRVSAKGNEVFIVDFGKIVDDPVAWHTPRYIYPLGYTCHKLYSSLVDPTTKSTYICSIVESVDSHTPLFRIKAGDKPDFVVQSVTPSQSWKQVQDEVSKVSGKKSTANISGPDYFGFSVSHIFTLVRDSVLMIACVLQSPSVLHYIQQMENADKCAKYIPQKWLPIASENAEPVAGEPNVE
eukprot:Partr_v1_DN27048_c0_g1_i2_m29081 putative transforming growth factor beta regulator 1